MAADVGAPEALGLAWLEVLWPVVLALQALSRTTASKGNRVILRGVTPHYSHTPVRLATVGRMMGDRWGVTDEEVARRYPCDEMFSAPVVQLWRGVTVDAPAREVWPWLCQLRLAPYSYDWLDNLGRRSPRELRGLPDPEPGERFSCMGGRFGVGRVLSVVHDEHLTAKIMGAAMSYVLIPEGQNTRLVLKIVLKRDHWYSHAVAAGDWPMARRQLKNLKALAEDGAGGR